MAKMWLSDYINAPFKVLPQVIDPYGVGADHQFNWWFLFLASASGAREFCAPQ